MKELLGKADFNIDSDLTLIKKKKPNDEEHSTPYTLLDLDYDAWDVVERLKELTVSEYSETKIDKGRSEATRIMRVIPLRKGSYEIPICVNGKEANYGDQHIN